MNRNDNMPVWLFRCNFNHYEKAYKEKVAPFYEKNRCPIQIQKHETWDKYCYNKLINENKSREEISWDEYAKDHPKEKKKEVSTYISKFATLANAVKQKAILVVLEYKDIKGEKCEDVKLGIIPKGKEIGVERGNNGKDYELFYYELESVIKIRKNVYSILNGLIPSNTTLGPINNRENAVNEFYHFIKDKTTIKRELENLPNDKIEDLCCEWLKTGHAKEYQLQVVYVENGKHNFPVLDIMGKTIHDQVLAAQVSYTESVDTIISKVKKLVTLGIDTHLMFTKLSDTDFKNKCKEKGEKEAKKGTDVKHISLQKVWEDLTNDIKKRSFIEKLFEDAYNNKCV